MFCRRLIQSLFALVISTMAELLVVTLLMPLQVPAQTLAPENNAVAGCATSVVARVSGGIDEDARVTLNGQVHPLARAEFDRGRVDDALPLEHIIMMLKRSPEQELAIQTRIDLMHNRRHPLFHQWLSADQVGSCYGVADQDIAAVSAWLETHGFKVDKVPAGKMLIIFTGTAGQVREAFHTEIHNLDVRGEKHIANMTAPQIPAALVPVVAGFRSLHNFFPKPTVHIAPPQDSRGVHSLLTFSNNGTTWYDVGPQDLYTIYDERPLLTASNGYCGAGVACNGAGQTLAVVEPSDIAIADVTTFRSQFGLPAYPSSPNSTQGGVNYMFGIGGGFCADPGKVSTSEDEAALDVEWMGATAPNAIIDFVACADTATTAGVDLAGAWAVNDLAGTVSAISVSYGVCEAQLTGTGSQGIWQPSTYYQMLWEQAVAEGQTVVVSAGDSGDDTCDRGNVPNVGSTGLSVNGISSTPYDISVGGTDFSDSYQGQNGTYWNTNDTSPFLSALSYVPEIAWNGSCGSPIVASFAGEASEQVCNDPGFTAELVLDGGGGGISTIYSLPTWQSVYGVGLSSNFTSTGQRNLPDISMFAADFPWQHRLVYCNSDSGSPCDYTNGADALANSAGGTSFVAPMFTGIIGLINQAYPSGNPAQPTRQGQANYTLYALATGEYGTRTAENTSTTKPSVYTCESNDLAISAYGIIFPDCIFYDLNRTPAKGTSTCVGANNTNCIVENNDQPCTAGTPDCFTVTGNAIGLLSLSTTAFGPAYPQSAGYDAATGLGSFNITNLVTKWNTVATRFVSTTVVTADPDSISTSGITTLTAKVTATGRGGIAPPLGTVTFYAGTSCSGTALGAAALAPASGCTTSCYATASLPGVTGTQLGGAGTQHATGCFSGDGANDAPSNGSVSITVGTVATTTALTSSPNPSTYQEAVAFTATVSGGSSPTGTVNFSLNGTTIAACSAVTLASGKAVCTTEFEPVGTNSVIATYSGDSKNAGSISPTLSQVVNVATTTTTLVSSENPSSSGESVTFTATISPGTPPTPTGTVAFKANGTVITGCSAVAVISVTSTTATCTTASLAVGNDTILAAYSGDSNYSGSSGSLTQSVNSNSKFDSNTTVASTPNPANSGQSVTITATVTPVGLPTPTGTMAFTTDGITIAGCSAVALNASRVAACTTSTLPSGTDLIVVNYSGDTSYLASNGSLSQLVDPGQPAVITTAAGCCETTGGPGTSGFSGDNGPATKAELSFAGGVGVDSAGNFYIGDTENNRVREVTIATGKINTLAGGATTVCSGATDSIGDGCPATSAIVGTPYGVAVDSAGDYYVADTNYRVIRKVTAGIISTVAGEVTFGNVCSGATDSIGDGCPATSATLSVPIGLALDSAGNLYIADTGECVVRKVAAATGIITTAAGTATGAGTGSNCGYSGDGGLATKAEVQNVEAVAVDSSGNLYIADADNCLIRKVAASTGIITSVAGTAAGAGTQSNCGYTGDGGPATKATLNFPLGVAVDSDSAGNLYIADNVNNVIRKVTAATGIITTVAGNGFGAGSCESNCIGGYTGDGGPPTSAELFTPTSIAVDSAGNLYIGDSGNFVVRKATPGPTTASTMTFLSSSLNPSTSTKAVTLTAMVADGSSPTGTVRFTSNRTTISGCAAVALSSGAAQCNSSTLAAGSDAIVATYSGDSANAGSTGALTQVVNSSTATVTATTLTSSLSPSASGQLVTITATVTPAGSPTPTGTVSFSTNGSLISGCAGPLSSSRTATCTLDTWAVGTDAIVAIYSGDSKYAGSIGSFSQLVSPTTSALQFVPVTPCRVVDTRTANGAFGGPSIPAASVRSFAIPEGPCSIPSTAMAYSLNVTVVPPGPLGYLTIWPMGEGQPASSTLNSLDGRIKANAAIVPAGSGGAVSIYASNPTNVLLDIDGYFVPGGSTTLEFYPLTPCRIADTRKAAGSLGGPSLVADKERDFPVLSSACGLPSSAKAYSLNFTVVPPATGDAIGYLTVWAQGQTKPLVSTLNDLTGTIVANAAIVPAGTSGGVAVYPSNATNLLIDVNGYFAPPGSGGLSLYSLAPCRVLNTSKTTGTFSGELTLNVSGSACAPPSTAKAYVFNATVVPTGDLGYLTLWPDGQSQPVVSTLNAVDGAITSNMAIVPNTDGKTDAYASGTTQLILDISAYFAP